MDRDERRDSVEVEAREAETMSVREFERAPDSGWRTELVRGVIVREPPAGAEHGSLAARILAHLARHVEEQDLGVVLAAETGFRLSEDPDGTVRAPDAAFVAKARIPAGGMPEGFWPGPPDLAVEVVSPSNSADEILGKVVDFLKAGMRAVWVGQPRARSVTVYRSRRDIRILAEHDALENADVLPGFRLPLAELFRG